LNNTQLDALVYSCAWLGIGNKEAGIMHLSWDLVIYVFFIQFFACIIKGLVGFGNPLISSPLLAMRLNNNVITPMNLPLDWAMNAYIVLRNRKSFKWRTTVPVACFLMAGVVPGTFFLKLASPWVLKAVLGAFIIGLGIEMWTRSEERRFNQNWFLVAFLSIISGFMAGLYGINMIILAYFERIAGNRKEFRSNICFVYLIENSFRIVMYVVTGIFTGFTLKLALISLPAAMLGLFVGGRIDSRLDERKIKRIIIIVFILGGLSILIKALVFQE
jgi:uncharacterized membrane protein YfcA